MGIQEENGLKINSIQGHGYENIAENEKKLIDKNT